jgi:hypothetical protein
VAAPAAALALLAALSTTLTGDDADGALVFGVPGTVLPLVTLGRTFLRDRERHATGP